MKPFIACSVLLGLSATFLTPPAKANTPVPLLNKVTQGSANANKVEEFIARGTEPFWGITVAKTGITYSSPDAAQLKFPYTPPLQAVGRPADLVRVYRLRGRTNGTLILNKVSNCSDGMSDNEYPYSATLILGNTVREGCASRK